MTAKTAAALDQQMDRAADLAERAIEGTRRATGRALDKVEAEVQEARDEAAFSLSRAVGKVEALAARTRDQARDATHRARERLEEAGDQTRAYIRDEPVKSVLIAAAERAGLDVPRAAEILSGDEFRNEVRQKEQLYLAQGIQSVPSVIINNRYLVQGGQPVEMFERALREVAQEA